MKKGGTVLDLETESLGTEHITILDQVTLLKYDKNIVLDKPETVIFFHNLFVSKVDILCTL